MLASGIIVRLLGLAVVLGMVVAAVTLWRRLSRSPLFLPAARRKIGPLGKVRIACGALGGLIVIGTVVGTWQTVRHRYAQVLAPAGQTVRVPTRAVGPEEMGTEAGGVMNDVRLLVDVLVMDARCPEIRPVHLEQFDVRGSQMVRKEAEFRLNGRPCTYYLEINGIRRVEPSPPVELSLQADPKAVTWRATGLQSIRWTGPFRTQRWNSASINWSPAQANLMWIPVGAHLSPLSVTPLTPSQYYCLTLLTPVAVDDPLRTVPLEEYVQLRQDVLRRSGIYGAPHTAVEAHMEAVPAGALRLGTYLGMPMLLLPAAAVLLSQLFRRRNLAAAALILGLLLYVAVSERVLLAHDLSRLVDPAAPLQVRLVAADRLAMATFFYKDTALHSLTRMAARQDVPAMLRDKVQSAVTKLAESRG